jgi:hypothetical protein
MRVTGVGKGGRRRGAPGTGDSNHIQQAAWRGVLGDIQEAAKDDAILFSADVDGALFVG